MSKYDFDAVLNTQAQANLAQGASVPPQQAVDALKVESPTGVPAPLGMHDPAPLTAQAKQQEDQSTLLTSPSVRSFVASSPAKAAAVKDDFGPLSRLAATAKSWGSTAATDFFAPGVSAARDLVTDIHRAYHNATTAEGKDGPLSLIPGFSPEDKSLGSVLADVGGIVFSPVSGALNVAARPLSYIPRPVVNSDFSLSWATQPQAQAAIANEFGTALMGLGAGGLFRDPLRAPTIYEGNVTPGPKRLVGPQEPVVDAEFHDIAPPGVNPAHSPTYDAVAQMDVEHVARMQEALTDTATHSRAPALTQDFLENHTAVGGATASVDAESVAKLLQQGHEVFTDQLSALRDALATGSDLQVPLAQYLAETAGQPFAEDLNAQTRFRESGVSVEEGKALPKEASGEEAQEPETPKATPFNPPEGVAEGDVKAVAAKADEAVQQVFKEHALGSLFSNGKAAGLTESQLARYSSAIEEAQADLHDRILQRTYSQLKRELTPEWKEKVAARAEEIAGEADKLPVIRAHNALAQPGYKLDRDLTTNFFPEPAGRLDKSVMKVGGNHPDTAADLVGYESGAQMVGDLADLHSAVRASGAKNVKDYIKQQAFAAAESEQRVKEEYDVSPEGILALAREAMTAPEIADVLTKDLAEFAKANGLPFDKDAVKALAQEQFGKLAIEDAIKPKTFAENMRRLGNKAEAALFDGKAIKAFTYKQQQLLQFHQLGESFKLAKAFAKDLKLWNSIAKKPMRNGVSQDAVNWSKDILSQMGMRVRGNSEDLTYPISGYPDLRSFIVAKTNTGADIVWAPVPRAAKPQEMSVDAYRGVSDMVRSIIKTGREEQLVRVGNEKRDLEATVDAGIAQLSRYTRTITHEEKTDPTVLQRIDRARRFVDAWGVRLEQLMLDFGERDPNSPFFQVVSRRLEDAKGWSLDKRTELAKHFNGVNKDVGKGFDAWMKARLPQGPHKEVLTRAGDPIFNTNKDITVAALHLGDAEALKKFAEGYNTTPEEIESIVAKFATPQMWKAVEGIWKAFADLRAEIEKQFRARTGVTPKMVEPRPFTNGAHSSKGGYFPVMYDPAGMPKEWLDSLDPNAMLGDARYVRAVPSNKYLKQRTGVSAPVQMNLDQIYSRLNQVIHDLAYRDVLNDINKFLLHPRMGDAISRKYGPEYVGKIRRNLERIARAESTDTNENRAVSKAVDYLTEGQMINMIGLSPTTVLKHGTTAAFQPLAEVGPVRYAGAIWDYMRDANSVGRAAELESPEVRHIISAYGEDSYQQFLALTSKTGLAAKYRRFAFHTIGFVNKQIAIATYNAAKEKLRDENPGIDEGTVRAGANQIVRQALGSSGPTDAPDALSASRSVPGRFYRLQNQFLTFFSHMYNRAREIPQALGYAGNKIDLSRAIALLITSIIIPVTVDAVFGREVKKTGSWLGGLSVSLIHQIAAPWPGINTAVGAGLHIATHGEYQSHDSALASIGEMVGTNVADIEKALKKHEVNVKMVQHALITLGQFVQAPGLEASRLLGFFHDMAEGKEQNKALPQQIEDFIYGPQSGKHAKTEGHK